MASNNFWQRSIKLMFKKYLGWEWRLIPLVGFFALIIPALFWREYRWADALVLAALLVLCVCFALAVHDIWEEDYQKMFPYYKVHLLQQECPQKFILLEPYIIGVKVNKHNLELVGCQAKIRSWLFEDISINQVTVDLSFPLGGSKYRKVQFSTKDILPIQLSGLEHGAQKCWNYIVLVCEDKASGEIPNFKKLRIEGQARILTNSLVFPKIITDIWGDVEFVEG